MSDREDRRSRRRDGEDDSRRRTGGRSVREGEEPRRAADRGREAARAFARGHSESGRGGPGPGGRAAGTPDAAVRIAGLVFTRRELIDFGAAWVALGLAFTFFLYGPEVALSGAFLPAILISMATVGVGFVVHELAHKVVAVRFGKVAHFQADYGMLALSVVAGLGRFLFAAPGAVVHAGRSTPRQNGLIALAGPAVNVALLVLFAPLLVVPGLEEVGRLGVLINAVLAAFNLIPFGPLDGATVRAWSTPVWAGSFVVGVALAGAAYLFLFAGGLG